MREVFQVLQHFETVELRLCRYLNRHLAFASVRRSFLVVSRLGDGVFWCAVILAMPMLTASPAPTAALQMAVTGLIASGLQAVLKAGLARS